jgi:4-amino-4-deoxy-L-arabinose transferase-like glycosyltransferase
MNARIRASLLLLGLFLLAWIPRTAALDAYVSPDERKWLARSANFTYALSQADYARTFQREHPGVTVMWAGTLGLLSVYPDYPRQTPGYFTWEREHFETWLQTHTPHTPLELLAASRRWVALGVALLLLVSFFPLRRLLGQNTATLALLLLALDPFGVALSRQLHPDGFVAGFVFVAFVYFLAWLYTGQQRRDLLLSGLFMGLAWLTKTPAALLLPAGAVLVAAQAWRIWAYRSKTGLADPYAEEPPSRPPPSAAHAIRMLGTGFVLWATVAAATFFLLWPAMWVDPLGSLLRMATEMEAYVEGHVNTNFFWGAPTPDPGPLFYPVAIFWRLTPAVLVGTAAAFVFYARREWVFAAVRTRRSSRALLWLVLVFVLAMSVPAKKFDRYILPAFLALDTIAAIGWMALIQLPWRRQTSPWVQRLRTLSPTAVLAAAIFGLHGLFTLLTYPYYLTYFNPLAGGSYTAPQVLFVGWGEGLDDAARWIRRQPGGDQARIAAWYADGPFSYFSTGTAVPMGYSSPLSWLDTDYAVTYVNQWQRQLPSPAAVAWFASQEPVHEVTQNGLVLARVYDLRQTLLPPFIDLNTAPAADFGGSIRLVGVDLPQPQVQAGAQQQVTFYLQSLGAIEANYNVLVRLVSLDGSELWRSEGWPWGAPTAGWPPREVRPDGHRLAVPADTPPGLYPLLLSFYDPTTLAPLPAADARSGAALPSPQQTVALLQVVPPPDETQKTPASTARWQLGNSFGLAAEPLPPTVEAGAELEIRLHWQVLEHPQVRYTLFLHLVDSDGQLVAQQDQPPLGESAPTYSWQPGQQIGTTLRLALPSDLPAGPYTLRAGLYNGERRLPVSQQGEAVGDFAALAVVEVP